MVEVSTIGATAGSPIMSLLFAASLLVAVISTGALAVMITDPTDETRLRTASRFLIVPVNTGLGFVSS